MTDGIEKSQLTKWANEPTISGLKQNLDDAQVDQDAHLADITRWMSNFYIDGSAKLPVKKGQSSVQPKVIRKQAEWRYPSLSEPFLSSPDIFNVLPTTAGDRTRAQQNALVLNHQFNHKIKRVSFIDACVRDLVDLGTVICKVGWVTEEEERETEKPIYQFIPSPDPNLTQQYMNLLQLRKMDQDLYSEHMNPGLDQALDIFTQSGQTVIPQQVGSETVTELVETKNHPTVEVCVPENIVIDPSCNGDLSKANFVVEKFKSSLSELKKDGRYKNLDRINIEDASPIADPDYEPSKDQGNFNFEDEPRKQFVVHSYWGNWDIDNSGIAKPIVAFWVNDTMIRIEENPFPDKKHPFVKMVYMPVRKSMFGEPDGELLEDNQKIIGALTRGMIDLMGKSANSQTGFKKGLMDLTNMRKFKRGDDYEFNSNEDPRQGIFTHTFPDIPAAPFNLLTQQNSDAESLTGVKAYNTGITGAALGDSVKNGRSALDAASKREMGILRRLAEGIVEIGYKFISMNAEFLSEEEVVRLTNKEFISVRRDDLAGHYDLELTISTAEEDNKKAEELAFMLQTMGNNMDPNLSKMILSDIARLRKMPDMAKKIEEYEPQPDPLVQAEQELKIKHLEAQIAKEQALAMKHSTEAELNGVQGAKEATQARLNTAKEGTERAKTRQLSSQADRTDLDYLEQESGVLQARELQKIDTQAKASKQNQSTKEN